MNYNRKKRLLPEEFIREILKGIVELADSIVIKKSDLKGNATFYDKRQRQYVAWMRRIIQQNLESRSYNNQSMKRMIKT